MALFAAPRTHNRCVLVHEIKREKTWTAPKLLLVPSFPFFLAQIKSTPLALSTLTRVICPALPLHDGHSTPFFPYSTTQNILKPSSRTQLKGLILLLLLSGGPRVVEGPGL